MAVRILYVVLLVVCAVNVRAQNNQFKIDDSLYSIYLEAQRQDNDSEKLAIADSMYRVAADRKDWLGQCVALVIRMRYYYNKYDEKNLYATINRIQKLSRKSGKLLYYYYAWALKANYLKNTGRLLAATTEADAIKRQAEKDKSPYGIYTAMRMLGNIHENRGEYQMALHQYREALRYGSQEIMGEDISPVYRAMGWCYTRLHRYDEALKTFNQGISVAKSYEPRMACMMQRCFALYRMRRYGEFESTYREIRRMFAAEGPVQPRYVPRLMAMHYCVTEEYDKAMAEARKMQKRSDRLDLELLVYKARGNYRMALQTTEDLHRLKDSAQTAIQHKYLAEMNAKIGNTMLRNKTQQLKLNNARLIAAEMQAKVRNRLIFIILITLSAASIISLLVVHMRKTHRLMAELRGVNGKLLENNAELSSAREKAMEVDRMKTAFVQSISHEIRTPLNAVCGFAQILAGDDGMLSAEDKADVCRRIGDGTEQLARMVNEMLDIASLESGNMKLEICDVGINAVCRGSIARVSQAMPSGVEMRFTTEFSDADTMHTDGARVGQILQHYLTNAQKNTTEGYIELACRRQDSFVVFTVTDTGCGVPPESIDAVFRKFEKTDSFKQGAGLGLSVALHIANVLGGKVGIDTDYRSGARFWFKLLM